MRYNFVGWTFALCKFIWKRKHPDKRPNFNPDYSPNIPLLLELNSMKTNVKGASNGSTKEDTSKK